MRYLVGICLIGTLGVIAWANKGQSIESLFYKWKVSPEVPLEVQMAPIGRANIVQTVQAPGDVEADVEVKVSAQVMGRIIELPVQEGDLVKKGDVVVKLDDDEYRSMVDSMQARIDRLKAMLESSEADLKKAERDYDEKKVLARRQAIGLTELRDFETTLSKMRNMLTATKAELRDVSATMVKAEKDLEKTVIRSPINGIISRLDSKIGEVVVIGTMNNEGTVIMTISDPARMIVRARIDETDVPSVKVNQKAIIHLQHSEDLTVTGEVIRIAPKGSKGGQARTSTARMATNDNNSVAIFEAIILLKEPPPACKLGMSANVDIQVTERVNAVSAPSRAILHRRKKDLPKQLQTQINEMEAKIVSSEDPSKRYYQVAFINNAGKSECRLVKTGVSDTRNVEILSGLKESETIITGPYRVFDKLQDGKLVKEISSSSG